jgi:hypothetical protein
MATERQVDLARTTAAVASVQGEIVVHRLYDVGYEIDLERAFALLGDREPERPKPARGEAQAIQISNPPVAANLGTATLTVGGDPRVVELSARVFDFGVASLRGRVEFSRPMPWSEFLSVGPSWANAPEWKEIFQKARESLRDRIRSAITKPGDSPVTEDYVMFRIHRLLDADNRRLPVVALKDEDIAQLLTGEGRPLSAAVRRDLLTHRFSYFEDDLTVLTWNAALVVEPVVEDSDVQYVIEFANAQLLELRYYDALLDEELPRMYDGIREARHGFHLLGRHYSRMLGSLQTRVAEVTELVERSENALKMTDDMFLARIYAAALELFRGRVWRQGIDEKLAIVRDAYSMLNAETQARRAEILEVIIVLLIALEIVLAFVRH